MSKPTLLGLVVLGALVATSFAQPPASPPSPAPAASPPVGNPETRTGPAISGAAAAPDFLTEFAATSRYTLGRPRGIQPTPKGEVVFFMRSGPRSFVQDLYLFDVTKGEERVFVTAQALLAGGEEQLTQEERARRERLRMTSRGISGFHLSPTGDRLLVPLSGRLFVIDRASGARQELVSAQGPAADPQWSPDGLMVAAVRGSEVWVTHVESGEEWAATSGAAGSVSHGSAEFVAQEEMSRFHGYWWSPDSASIVYQRTDTAAVETLYIADPMNPARAPESFPYPRAGRANAEVTLHVAKVERGKATAPRAIEWDRSRFPYVATVTWSENAPLTILVQNRRQTEQVLLSADTASGETKPLIRESDPAWLNIHESCPVWLKDGSGFLWITDAPAGAADLSAVQDMPRLEVRGPDGSLRSTVTPPGFPLLALLGFDQATGTAWVTASPDGARVGVYSIACRGVPGPATEQHTGNGVYGAIFAEDHSTRVVTASTLAGELSWTLRSAAGKPLGALTSVAQAPPFTPALELTRVKIKDADLNAVIIRPRTLEKGRVYPVINQVYGGPGSNTVNASAMGYLLHQWIADRGFIVVSIDARGTPRRGRAWERVIKNDVITIPLAEQAEAVQALCARYPEMDKQRIGISGWSFGGYFSAMATMRRPDVFTCGVAGAPVCAWEDYDTHYTERYLDLPESNADGYREGNVETWCKDLRVPLMIVHGTADDNVYFLHALRMTGELFRRGRPFEFVTLPGMTHVVAEPGAVRALQERTVGFFERHLRR
ncbi:MAG: DPP IV N-terminal domain-containing protein [Phycisphaerales bacterium]